jgi:serine/threonine protein kinase
LVFKYLKPSHPARLRDVEISANQHLKDCPNLICALDPSIEYNGSHGWFMRRCRRGDLLELVLSSPITEAAAQPIFYRIAIALAWLHSHGWAHRCIQPENILLDGEATGPIEAYLGDLSFAKQFKEGDTKCKFVQPVGSPLYCAPELWRGERYDQSVDIWAFGASLFVALTGTAPFLADPEDDRALFLTYAEDEEFEIRELTQRNISQQAVLLIQGCLRAIPEERLTAAAIKEHPFFAAAVAQ